MPEPNEIQVDPSTGERTTRDPDTGQFVAAPEPGDATKLTGADWDKLYHEGYDTPPASEKDTAPAAKPDTSVRGDERAIVAAGGGQQGGKEKSAATTTVKERLAAMKKIEGEKVTVGLTEIELSKKKEAYIPPWQAPKEPTPPAQAEKSMAEIQKSLDTYQVKGVARQMVEDKLAQDKRILDLGGGRDAAVKVAAQDLVSGGKVAAEMLVPGVYVAANWKDLSPTEKAIWIAVDVASLIPGAKLATAAAREIGTAGKLIRVAAASKAVGRYAVESVRAPVDMILYPERAIKATAKDIRNFVDVMVMPRRLPSAVITTSDGTVRLLVKQTTTPADAMKIRDTLMELAAKGERPIVQIGKQKIELTRSPLMREVGGGLAHSTPQGEAFTKGLKVSAKEGMPAAEQGLFMANEPLPRFAEASAFGKVTGEKPAIYIVSKETATKSISSGKIYKSPVGAVAEMERKFPVGTKLPAPRQILYTRIGPESELAAIMLEKPLNARQILQLKSEGLMTELKTLLKEPIKISGKGDVSIATGTMDKGLDLARATTLARVLRESGNTAQASNLIRATAVRVSTPTRTPPRRLSDVTGIAEEPPRTTEPPPEEPPAETPPREEPPPEEPRAEEPRVEEPRTETPRTEEPRVERPPREEPPRPERPSREPQRPVRPERAIAERPTRESQRPERPERPGRDGERRAPPPRREPPRREPTRREPARRETPRRETPRRETPRKETPRREPVRQKRKDDIIRRGHLDRSDGGKRLISSTGKGKQPSPIAEVAPGEAVSAFRMGELKIKGKMEPVTIVKFEDGTQKTFVGETPKGMETTPGLVRPGKTIQTIDGKAAEITGQVGFAKYKATKLSTKPGGAKMVFGTGGQRALVRSRGIRITEPMPRLRR